MEIVEGKHKPESDWRRAEANIQENQKRITLTNFDEVAQRFGAIKKKVSVNHHR